MRLFFCAILAGAAALAPAAHAGVYADDLSKCLVKSSSPTDQLTLMKWMFSSMSANPQLTALTTITAAQRVDYNKAMTTLVERLMFVDCRPAAVEALKYEGPVVIQQAFQVLGQVAARGLFTDPATVGELQNLQANADTAKWNALMTEAGLPPPNDAPAKAK